MRLLEYLMTKSQSFQDYADIYDIIYQDKDYLGECDFIEAVLNKYGCKRGAKILDVSVGTGGHALILSQKGYQLTGFDYSSQMAAIAEKKAALAGLSIPIKGGISMAALPQMAEKFDAVISIFASVNYLTEKHALREFLRGASRSVNSGGILMFDFWNGITCLREYSEARTKEIKSNELRIERTSTTKLDPMQNGAVVSFDCKVHRGQLLERHIQENHSLRYFFPIEVAELAEDCDFEVLAMLPFKELQRPANEKDWYVSLVARKK